MRKGFFVRAVVCAIACVVIGAGGIAFTVTAQAQQCTFTPSPTVIEARHSGGTYTINFTASGSACNWNISSADDWITVPDTHRGTGTGTIVVTVKPNTGTAARQGRVILNRQYIWVNQPQRPPCTYTLRETSKSVPAGGTSANYETVLVTASDPSCTWSVGEKSPWIRTYAETKTGTATARYAIGPNLSGSTRTGTIKIAGQTFTVTQKPCTYTLRETSKSIPAGGTSANYETVLVTASDARCTWSVGEKSPWIRTYAETKTGTATARYAIGPNLSGSTRTGTIKIAGQTLTLTQEPCTYTVSPASINHSASRGGTGFRVTTNHQDCPWTVETTAGWIGIGSDTRSAKGNGSFHIQFMENRSTAARSTVIKVKTASVNVTQQGGTATPATQASSGTDPTSAQTSVGSSPAARAPAAKTSPAAPPCSYTLSKTSQNVGQGNTRGSFSVKTDSGCEWKAVANTPWIIIASASSGKGKGTVKFTVEENRSSSPRTGQISVAGQTFSVNQKGQKTGNKEKKHK